MIAKGVLASRILLLCAALLAIVAVLPGAYAANPIIYDGAVLAGYKYTTSIGEEFKLTYFESGLQQKVVVDFPGETLVIENNSCETGKRLQGCFNGAFFKGYNYSLPDRVVYEYKIKLSLQAPDIQVTNYIERDEVEVGEETTVHVNITNAGTAPGTVYFDIKVPTEANIIEIPDQSCQLSKNNTLLLIADFKEGEIKHCDYKVVPLSPGTYSLTSNAEFDVLTRQKAAALSTLKVKALPVSINANLTKQVLLGDPLNITFNITASQQVASFIFNAFLPSGITIISMSKAANREQQDDLVKVSYGEAGTALAENTTVIINVNTQTTSVGELAVRANASWRLGTFRQRIELEYPISVTFASPYFRLNSFDPQTGKASIDVVNPAHLPIYNVIANFNSFADAGGRILAAESINSLSHASFNLIQTLRDGNFNGTIRYSTQYGQELVAETKLPVSPAQIIIQPPAKNLSNASAAAKPAAATPPIQEDTTKAQAKTQAKSPSASNKGLTRPAPLTTALIIVAVIIILLIFTLIMIVKKQQRGGPISQ